MPTALKTATTNEQIIMEWSSNGQKRKKLKKKNTDVWMWLKREYVCDGNVCRNLEN